MIIEDRPIIGKLENNYGYLVALGIDELFPRIGHPVLHAVFESAGRRITWIVPDVFLFKMLLKELGSMSLGGDCQRMGGTQKLVISNENNQWCVQHYWS